MRSIGAGLRRLTIALFPISPPIVLLLLMAAPAALGDVTTTAITGVVTASGDPLDGVTVVAASPLLKRATITGGRGTYWLGGIPPGEYDVTFSRAGFQTLTRRIVVQLARVARADALLEPTDDDESVIATARSTTVAETMPITTHRTAEDLTLFPLYPQLRAISYAAPLPSVGTTPAEVDDFSWAGIVAAEAIDEVTLIHAVRPLELGPEGASSIRVATRTGSDRFSVRLRNTMTNLAWVAGKVPGRFEENDTKHFTEGAIGGPLIRERLWFFGSAFRGDRVDEKRPDGHGRILTVGLRSARGLQLKVSSQLASRHHLLGQHLDSERALDLRRRVGATATFVHHTAQWQPRLLTELSAGQSTEDGRRTGVDAKEKVSTTHVRARGAFVAGSHVISGGGDFARSDASTRRFIFLSDRWVQGSWSVVAGAAHRDGHIEEEPRPLDGGASSGQLAVSYDLTGDGRRAILASASRYAGVNGEVDEATLSIASAIGAAGAVRLDAIRRKESRTHDSLRIDAWYRLFDRIGFGANYTWSDHATSGIAPHIANAWVTAEIPLGAHTLGASLVQQYGHGAHRVNFRTRHRYAATDIGVRYTVPFDAVGATLAIDAVNLFDERHIFHEHPRTFRLWVRLVV